MSSKPTKTDKEEQHLLELRGKFKGELLSWVTNPDREITQDVDALLDHVMKDRRRRIEVFLTALASKYVQRSVYLVGQMPGIEQELLRPERLHTMKNSDLIRLLGLVSNHVDSAAQFLRNFVSDDDLKSEPLPSPGSEFAEGADIDQDAVSDEDKAAAEALPVESRRRIDLVLRKVLGAMSSIDPNVGTALPPPQKTVEVETVDSKPPKKKSDKKKATKKRSAKSKDGE